jgi:hypothetical protein
MPALHSLAPALLALALTLALGGCHLPGAEGADCEKDEDCDQTLDLGCWQGICQRLSPAAGPLAFEVVPRTSEGLEPAAFAPGSTDGVVLSVCPPETVEGTLEDLPAEFAVDIEAVAATPIPGLSRRFTATLPAAAGGIGPRTFSLSLPPARWRLRFTSRDGQSPPLATSVEVPGCARVPSLEVAPPGRYARDLALHLGPGPLGHCGASVQALDPATLEPLSAAVVARGDGDACPDPTVRLWVDDVDATVDLFLRVRPAPGGVPAVASQELPFRSHPGADGLCPPDREPPCPDAATIDLLPPDGDVAAVLAPVTVEVEDALGRPVDAGTVERIEAQGLLDGVPEVCGDPLDRATCGWGQGTLPATFGAGEQGPGPAVSLPLLLPGRYGFAVVPSPASGFAITAVPATAIDPTVPVRVRLAARITATGTVTFEGRSLPALVRAEPLGTGRPATVEAGADGRFSLALDPGPYRLEVRPRDPERSVPWGSFALPEGFAGGTLELALPSRARVRGRAVSGAEPVVGAVIRAFRCEPAAAADATPDFGCASPGATARPVGEAITGDDGSFAMLVPGN